MERMRVSPTKSSLIRVRDELLFAREGKELLTQKREVLVMELLRLQDDAQKAREELDVLLGKAYRAFGEATARTGFDAMARLTAAGPALPEIRIRERSVMGVVVPMIDKPKAQWTACFGLAAAPLAVDRAGRLLFDALLKLVEVAEIETAIYRLAADTRRTLRRERALENLFIPQYRQALKFIQESLEEKERENFYQMKLLKGKARQ